MTLQDRTLEEQRVLEETQRALAAGDDPFGDDEELVREGHGASGEAGDTGADAGDENEDLPAGDGGDGQPGGGEGGEQQAGAAGAEEAAAAQAAGSEPGEAAKKIDDELDEGALAEIADPLQLRGQPAQFAAEEPKDFKEQRKALLTEKSAAMKKLMDGEIDADQHAIEEERISDQLDALTRQQVRAETLHELNTQNAAHYQRQVIQSIMRSAKGQIDYATDMAAAKQFDTALQVLGADPDNAGKDFAELADQAHRTVAALRGVQLKRAGAPAPAPPPAGATVPDRTPKTEIPPTLRGIPAAAQSQTGGGAIDAMKGLTGQAYEEAYARLTPAQKASLLDD